MISNLTVYSIYAFKQSLTKEFLLLVLVYHINYIYRRLSTESNHLLCSFRFEVLFLLETIFSEDLEIFRAYGVYGGSTDERPIFID